MPDSSLNKVKRPEALKGLVAAGMFLSRELELERILNTIVETVRDIVGCRYAALAVLEGSQVKQFITSGIDAETRKKIGGPPRGRGILGVLVREARPLILTDLSNDPRSVGFPPNHPPMRSFLGVPVIARGSVFGNLYMTEKLGSGGFTEEDQAIAVTMAAQAGVAIETARLIEQERMRLEAEVHLQTERARANLRREVFRRAIQAQEAERRRLARELHDETGQALTSIVLGLRLLESTEESKPIKDRLSAIREQAVESMQELRRMVVRIRPTALDDLGLIPAIQRLLDESPLQHHATVTFVHSGVDDRLDSSVETAVYRIIQEALTNVARHAEPRQVSVTLDRNPDELRAVVEDDGCGFRPKKVDGGVGLAGMRERAEIVGGSLLIESAPSQGTTVAVRVPLVNGAP